MIEAILESLNDKIGEYKHKIAKGAAIGTVAAMPFIFSPNLEAGVGKYLYDTNDVINVGTRKYTLEEDLKEFEIQGKSAYLIKTEEDAVLFFWLGKNAKKQYAARSVKGKPVMVNKAFSIRDDDGKEYRIYPNGDVKRITTTTTWEDNKGRTVKKQVPYERPSADDTGRTSHRMSAEEYTRKMNEDYRKRTEAKNKKLENIFDQAKQEYFMKKDDFGAGETMYIMNETSLFRSPQYADFLLKVYKTRKDRLSKEDKKEVENKLTEVAEKYFERGKEMDDENKPQKKFLPYFKNASEIAEKIDGFDRKKLALFYANSARGPPFVPAIKMINKAIKLDPDNNNYKRHLKGCIEGYEHFKR